MNKSDLVRNSYMLRGSLSRKGYMRWWHSFCGVQPQTGERRTFFIEYIIMNPSLGQEQPVLGQLPYHKRRGIRPSYVCIKAGAFGSGNFSCNNDTSSTGSHTVSDTYADTDNRTDSAAHSMADSPADSAAHSMADSPNDSAAHSMADSPADSTTHSMAGSPNDSTTHSMADSPNDSTTHSMADNPADSAVHSIADSPTDSAAHSGTQLHRFYPINALRTAFQPFIFQAGENFYSENHIYGYVEVSHEEACRRSYMCDEGSMEWDLEVHKSIACHTGHIASPFFCALNALQTFWHGEGIQAQYRGTVTLNGISYEVTPEDSYGYADKHWGKNFNKPWLQFASCHLISETTGHPLKHSALAADGCCPKLLFFPLRRRLVLQLTYEGEDFEFNFSRLTSLSRTKWNIRQTRKRIIWQIVARNRNAILKITGSCLKEQMLAMNYEAPDGSRPIVPLFGGGNGTGTLLLYRRTPNGKQLIDTLKIEDAFCEYGEPKKSTKRHPSS